MDLDDFTNDLDLYRILPSLTDLDHNDNELNNATSDNKTTTSSSSSSVSNTGETKIRPKFPPRTIAYLQKFQKLNERIVEVVTDYNLVSFIPVSIKDPRTLSNAINVIDKAIGFVAVKTNHDIQKQKQSENEGKEYNQSISSTSNILSGKILEVDDD